MTSKRVARITVTAAGTIAGLLGMAAPASAATTSTTAVESGLGVDPEAVLHQLQQGAKLAGIVAAVVVIGRLVRGQRRRSWGREQSNLHLGNKLNRGSKALPVMPSAAADADPMPGWLVTGSHTATRRAWSGSPAASHSAVSGPVGSFSARSGRPVR